MYILDTRIVKNPNTECSIIYQKVWATQQISTIQHITRPNIMFLLINMTLADSPLFLELIIEEFFALVKAFLKDYPDGTIAAPIEGLWYVTFK